MSSQGSDDQTAFPRSTTQGPRSRPRPRPRRRRWLRLLLVLLALLLVVVAGAALWLRHQLQDSLPQLEGEVALAGVALSAPVRIERDELGIPTLHGEDRDDLALATGFLHAQERFFQMDLMRRQAAGELSALFGSAALPMDRNARLHRLRSRAERAVERLSPRERELLESYAAGVNAGLANLGARPFEYLLLRTEPEAWRAEDSFLVVLAMYFVLQDSDGSAESDLGLLYDLFPRELADFLAPRGTGWDAPLVGEPFEPPPIPGPEIYDLRAGSAAEPLDRAASARRLSPSPTPPAADGRFLASRERISAWLGGMSLSPKERAQLGSNNSALAGSRTASGAALVADDMHLPLGVPNTWYRASFVLPADDGGEVRITGVTLPGIPLMVVGSNGHVAWGFTNSYGDWGDLVVLEQPAGDDLRYRTAEGFQTLTRFEEVIEVAGGESETFEVFESIWGPVVDRDHRGRRRALRWVGHDLDGYNLGLMGLEQATNLSEAFDVAHVSGIPAQNFVAGDAAGHIGWTIVGLVPRRVGGESGFDGRLPSSWATGERGWDGFLDSSQVPAIIDPPAGQLWTANARVVNGEMLATIGDGGYDLGARARQIRDDLSALDGASEPQDLLAIQLDDRALFLQRWHTLLLEVLGRPHDNDAELWARARRLVEETWNDHAAPDSVAFRLVRGFRLSVQEEVFDGLTAPLKEADERFRWGSLPQREGPLWRLVSEQPLHLLDPKYASWDAMLEAVADRLLHEVAEDGPLEEQTWGKINTPRIRHPLSRAVPQLAGFLDIETPPLPGATFMPRVQGRGFGASERMAVSPGHEADGYFHMPGGQSGHPLSPFYRAGHDAWVEGRPTPFLPGPTKYELILRL